MQNKLLLNIRSFKYNKHLELIKISFLDSTWGPVGVLVTVVGQLNLSNPILEIPIEIYPKCNLTSWNIRITGNLDSDHDVAKIKQIDLLQSMGTVIPDEFAITIMICKHILK
jgi:hypothetical protein